MQALIDMDVLVYEVGFAAQYKDDDGEPRVRGWDWVEESILQRIKEIEEEVWADEPSKFFLTTSEYTTYEYSKARRGEGEAETFKDNFRTEVATTKPYKGERKQEKPYHYLNIISHAIHQLGAVVVQGVEADDAICMEMVKAEAEGREVVCCSRDKDLAICPGLHYRWPCGKQLAWGPELVTELGWLKMEGNKLRGCGLSFFFSQMLMGDVCDNIPGLPRWGPKKAYGVLKDCKSESELKKVVLDLYKEVMGEGWDTYAIEQSKLLWMVQGLTEDGEPVHYDILGGYDNGV